MGRRHPLVCVLTDVTVLRVLGVGAALWWGLAPLCRAVRWMIRP